MLHKEEKHSSVKLQRVTEPLKFSSTSDNSTTSRYFETYTSPYK